MKLDANGNITWQKTYGGSNYDEATSIQQTSDGDFIVAGTTCSYGVADYNFWVLKLDAGGNVTWQKTYGGSFNASSIQQTSDGGFIVAGYDVFDTTSSFDIYVLKLDANGNVTWKKSYGSSYNDEATSIQQTSDGGFIVAGFTGNGYIGPYGPTMDIWVLKLNANGNVIWQKTYGGSDYDDAASIQQTSDNGFIVAGRTFSYGAGDYDFWVLKLDANGNVTWQKTYGSSVDEEATSIQQTSDGGFIVAGGTYFYSHYNDTAHIWVLKLDANGNIPGCNLIHDTSMVPANTNVIPVTKIVTSYNTTATVTSTSVIPQLTSATVTEQCFDEGPLQFVDVPPGYWAEAAIYKIYNVGITIGCSQNPLMYCPEDIVTRDQMAVFLGRGIHGSSFSPPPATGIFNDVPPTRWAANWIEQFYHDGITSGCPFPNYCPTNPVTRAQMAIFLLRSKHDSSYKPPAATGIFADVSATSWAAEWMEQLYHEGITVGCSTSPLKYCPNDSVTRAQMAKFIARTFGL